MNGLDLFLLSRTLMKIAEKAIPTEGIGRYSTSVRSVMVVMSDILEHPNSSIKEITERTGFPQSHVSAAIARLREARSVVTVTDQKDRRRVLARPADEVSERAAAVASSSIDNALAMAMGTDDEREVKEIVAVLETLARRLAPESLARLRAGSAARPPSRPDPIRPPPNEQGRL